MSLSLGFFHEHTRTDRDNYVTINWDNIKKASEADGRSWEHNFYKCDQRGCGDLKVGYDYDSIMHYGRTLKGYDAIVPKNGASIGQRRYLSAKDLVGINEHYECPETGKKNINTFMHKCPHEYYFIP